MEINEKWIEERLNGGWMTESFGNNLTPHVMKVLSSQYSTFTSATREKILFSLLSSPSLIRTSCIEDIQLILQQAKQMDAELLYYATLLAIEGYPSSKDPDQVICRFSCDFVNSLSLYPDVAPPTSTSPTLPLSSLQPLDHAYLASTEAAFPSQRSDMHFSLRSKSTSTQQWLAHPPLQLQKSNTGGAASSTRNLPPLQRSSQLTSSSTLPLLPPPRDDLMAPMPQKVSRVKRLEIDGTISNDAQHHVPKRQRSSVLTDSPPNSSDHPNEQEDEESTSSHE